MKGDISSEIEFMERGRKMSKLEKILRIGFCFVILAAFSFLGTQTASGQESNPPRSPAENPPAITLDPAQILSLPAPIYPSLGAPTVEWTTP